MNEQWTEITIAVPVADTDRASDIANMVVPYGIYIEDYSDLETGAREIAHIDLIDEDLLQKDRSHSLIHLYLEPDENPAESIAFLRERLSACGIENEVMTAAIHEADWANGWKQYFKPLPIGKRLLICPTWEQPPPDNDRVVLSIDPGMAFGTGGHETTRMVLEALETVIAPNTTFLDVGTGSGILSIAALLLGARSALGIDIDELAVKTAIENGALNGFAPPTLVMRQGDLAKDVTGQYDVVAANIVADAIIALSPAVRPLVKPGGVYLVSGIIDTREAEVLDALKQSRFAVETRFENRSWVCLLCRPEGTV
ncbi:MAG: 50S ribosomal protein L11 methyltransferase [Clostridia bacterium]|nr:50S ribosomal protein L11 methyltransferase [Clostridia bacterium]